MTPPISVIIPCYNQGHYLKDAIQSLRKCDARLFEVIIVNDGSTDGFTNQYIEELAREGYKVIFQDNMGLGEARNRGIRQARGEFILPLDADNRIHPDYLTKGLAALTLNKAAAVAYANARLFGEKEGQMNPGVFNLQRLMLGNYIDACALIRKSVIQEVGYYDNMKVMGFEDWDIWLRIAFRGYAFHYINETLFDYRVTSGSMIRDLNRDIKKQNEMEVYLREKYADKLDFDFVKNYFVGRIKRAPFRFVYKLLLEKYYPSRYKKLIRENKMNRGWLYDRG